MAKLICKDKKNYALSEDKEYEILKEEGNYVFVTNDNAKNAKYHKELFTEPEPKVVIPVRTEQDCINSVQVTDTEISFIDLDGNKVVFNTTLNETDSDISCGIIQVTGLNNLMDTIQNQVPTDNDDRLELKRELFKKAILTFLEENGGAAMSILSTNITGEDDYIEADEDLLPVLDEIAHFTSESTHNSASGNNIKLWMFYTAKL